MKKVFYLIPFLFISCNDDKEQFSKKVKQQDFAFGDYSRIIEVEGCEYVFYKAGYAGGLTHKGNCKNH